jgi:hypothetical protein
MKSKAKTKKIWTRLFILFPDMSKEGYKELFNLKGKKVNVQMTAQQRNASYFQGNAKINYVAVAVWLIIGIIMINANEQASSFLRFLGFLIMAVVIACIILSKIKAVGISKQEVENYVGVLREQLKQEGMNACGVDAAEVSMAGDPLSIVYYTFSDIATPHLSRDGISSNIEVTCFYAGLSQLYIYSCKCSIINNEKTANAQDFFYQDMIVLNIKTETTGKLVFEIKLNSGDAFKYNFLDDTQITQQLTAMKNLVRDKRNNTR